MAKYHLYIRAIPGYLGYYATVDGDILKKRGNSLFKLTPTKVHNGYYTVKIIHKDNNPENNRVGNLKWGTQSQNMKQMVNEGRQRKSKIINYKSEVLTLHSQGFSIPEIIKSVGISKTSVHRIIKGKL